MNKPKTIREALTNLGPGEYCGWYTLADCFPTRGLWDGPNDYEGWGRRVKRHWIATWICTDTQVGLSIITLDGEPVAVCSQTGRKSDEDVRFFSAEVTEKVLKVMEEFVSQSEDRHVFANLDEEIDPYWYERSEEYWYERSEE
jgi:hypothetical protein